MKQIPEDKLIFEAYMPYTVDSDSDGNKTIFVSRAIFDELVRYGLIEKDPYNIHDNDPNYYLPRSKESQSGLDRVDMYPNFNDKGFLIFGPGYSGHGSKQIAVCDGHGFLMSPAKSSHVKQTIDNLMKLLDNLKDMKKTLQNKHKLDIDI